MLEMNGLIKRNSVVQATEKAGNWAGCTLIVSDTHNFGVTAYLIVPTQGIAYVRLPFDAIEYIGESVLALEDEE